MLGSNLLLYVCNTDYRYCMPSSSLAVVSVGISAACVICVFLIHTIHVHMYIYVCILCSETD